MKINKTIIAGIFICFVVAITIWGLYFLKGSNLLDRQKKYIVVYDNIQGLTISSPVLINGFKVWQVASIYFQDNNNDSLIVELMLDKELKIREGSIAKIYSSDLMGSKSIELIMGKQTRVLEAGDTLLPDAESDLKEQVKLQMLPLKHKAERLMGSMDSVLVMVEYIFNETTKQNIRSSIASIKNTFENLERSTKNIDTIVSSGNISSILSNIESITSNVKNHNDEIATILSNLSVFTDSLTKTKIGHTIQRTNNAISKIDSITTLINSGQGTIGLLLRNDSLYRNLVSASASLDSLLVDFKKNPKRYIHFSAFGGKSE